MAITLRNPGTWAAITANSAVTLPTHQTGDMLIVRVAAKSAAASTETITIATAGWTKIGQGNNGTTNSGNGTGSVIVAAFFKVAESGSETNPTVSFSSGPSPGAVVAMAYQKDAGEMWISPKGNSGPDTTSNTAHSATIASLVRVYSGDLVDFFSGQADDTTQTVPTITQTGVTFDAVTESPAAALSSTTGNDIAADGGYRTATAGTATAAAVVTGTLSTAETGTSWMTVLRVVTPSTGQAQAYIKSIGVNNHGQAQGSIKQTYRGHGQAQSHVVKFAKQSGTGQAQGTIAGQFSTFNDTFTRTVSPGWGTADNGDTWSSTNAIYSTNGSVGRFTSSQQLSNLNFTEIRRGTEITFDFSIDAFRVEATDNIFYVALKGSSNSNALDSYIAIENPTSPGNTLEIGLSLAGHLIADTVFANPYVLNDTYTVKVQILGSYSSSRIRAKAWKVGDTEPGWLVDHNNIGDPYGPTHPQVRPSTHTPTITTTIDNFSSQNAYMSYTGQAQAFIVRGGSGKGQAQAVIDTGIYSVVDTYTRSVSDGLGDAETGGTYIITGTASQLDVNGTKFTYTASTTSSVTWNLNRLYQQGTAYEEYFDFSVVSFGAGTGNITLTPFMAYRGVFDGIDAQLIINNATGAATIRGDSVGTIVAGNNYRLKFRFLRPHPNTASDTYYIRYSLWDMTTDVNEPAFVYDTQTNPASGAFNTGVLQFSLSPGNSTVQMTFDNLNAYPVGWTESGQAQAEIVAAGITYGLGQAQAYISPVQMFQGVAETVTSDTTTTITVPAHAVGDRLIFLWAVDGIETTIWPSYITQLAYQDNSAMTAEIYYRDVDGSEGWNTAGGSTFDVTISSAEQATVGIVRIRAGFFEPLTPPGIGDVGFGNSTGPNPLTYGPFWGSTDIWLTFVGYDDGADTVTAYPTNHVLQTNYTSDATGAGVGITARFNTATSENPASYTLSAAEQWVVWTLAIRPLVPLTLGRGLGQAQALIAGIAEHYSHGQSQALIKNTYRGHGQTQAAIKAVGRVSAQAQARVGSGGALTYLHDTFTRTQGTLGQPDIGSYVNESGTISIDGSKLNAAMDGLDSSVTGYFDLPPHQGTDYQIDFNLSRTDADTTVSVGIAINETLRVVVGTNFYVILGSAEGAVFGDFTWIDGQTARLKVRETPGYIYTKAWNLTDSEPTDWTISDLNGLPANTGMHYGGGFFQLSFFSLTVPDSGSGWVDNLLITEAVVHGAGQAQARIKQTYRGLGQSQAWIKNTYYGLGQSQATIKQTYYGLGQAQADIKQTYTDKTGQAQAQIKSTYFGLGQAQATVKNTYFGLGQAQARILRTYTDKTGQAQGQIKQVYVAHGQAQGTVKTTYRAHAQAQGQIKNTYRGLGQSQAQIKQVYSSHGQAQAQIKQTYNQHGQAQGTIKQTYFGLGQAQGQIKQVYNVHGQAQAWIETTYNQHGQAQAWIEQTYSQHGQAQGQIKQAYVQHGQAQSWIETTYNQHGQSQAWIENTYYGLGQAQAKINAFDVNAHGQAQAQIKQTYYGLGQAQAKINAFGVNVHAQAQAKINAFDFNQYGQAQALIAGSSVQFGQAQAKINAFGVDAHGQAQADIKQTYYGLGQAAATIKNTYFGLAQAQAWIEQTSNGLGQAQGTIKQVYNGLGQSQAWIETTTNNHGQAQGSVKATYFALGQAQARILTTYYGLGQAQGTVKQSYYPTGQAQANISFEGNAESGQAQATIKTTYYEHGQAQGAIKQTYTQYGQAQADIKQTYRGYGQAQAAIVSTYTPVAQAQAWIEATVSQHGQAQGTIKATYVAHGQAQGTVKATYNGSGQAEGYILRISYGTGQAQATIKQTYNAVGQAQGTILQTYRGHGQAQALVSQTARAHGQAASWIENTYRGFGQAQAQILTGRFGIGQAQAQIVLSGLVNSAQAQAFIIKAAAIGQARAYIVTTHTLANVSVSDDAPIGITLVDEAINVTMVDEDSNESLTSDEDIFDITLSDEHPFTLELIDEAFI